MRFLRKIERLLLVVGLLLIAVFAGAYVYRQISSRAELKRFRDIQAEQTAQKAPSSLDREFSHDFSLWSEQRVAAYQSSLAAHFDAPLAILRISKVHLEVPVLAGTDESALSRGVGHIEGTVNPGRVGNVGIAGHRDGFFRVLKDVVPGDTIELETEDHVEVYRVKQIVIVKPDDVSVLQPRTISTLTLVTCYPFYFIGSAPKRYIVEASIIRSGPAGTIDQPQTTTSVRFTTALQKSSPRSRKPIKETTQ